MTEIESLKETIKVQEDEINKLQRELMSSDFGGASQQARQFELAKKELEKVRQNLRGWIDESRSLEAKVKDRQKVITKQKREIKALQTELAIYKEKPWFTRLFGF